MGMRISYEWDPPEGYPEESRRVWTPHEESNIENQIPEEIQNEQIAPEEMQVPENNEISISYVHMGEKWDRNNFYVNNIFAFQVALDIIQNDDDPEPQNTN